MSGFGSIECIEALLKDGHSGVDLPAAILLETMQAEGGVNIAPIEWMKKLKLCDQYNILLICDEIRSAVVAPDRSFL